MTVMWTEPARRLADQHAGRGIEGLWVLLHTAELAVLNMALLPGLDDDLAFTYTALDLREAQEELEWIHPELPRRVAAVDLGEAPLDQVVACRTAVVSLLAAALDAIRRLLETGHREMATPDVLAMARVAQLLAIAHLRVARTAAMTARTTMGSWSGRPPGTPPRPPGSPPQDRDSVSRRDETRWPRTSTSCAP
jgi:hypothetical protein